MDGFCKKNPSKNKIVLPKNKKISSANKIQCCSLMTKKTGMTAAMPE